MYAGTAQSFELKPVIKFALFINSYSERQGKYDPGKQFSPATCHVGRPSLMW
jgi:hypothetical protein